MQLSQSALRLLEQLSDARFHSGEALGQDLGISRAAISQHIAKLRKAGIVIHSVTGKGYQLAKHQQLLQQERLEKSLPNKLHYHSQLDSTNRYLLDRLGELSKGELCFAEMQTAGRGRRGRVWQSPLASQIIFSVYWPLSGGMQQASGLSLVVGIAMVEALSELGLQGLQLKWPNDIYHQGKKLGGILVEMNGQAQGTCHLIIGVGINVSMNVEMMAEVEQLWTDINSFSHEPIDRTTLSIALISSLNRALEQFEKEGMQGFYRKWAKWDLFLDKEVELHFAQRLIKGIGRGIDEQGALLLEQEGKLKAFNGGEISLRANEK